MKKKRKKQKKRGQDATPDLRALERRIARLEDGRADVPARTGAGDASDEVYPATLGTAVDADGSVGYAGTVDVTGGGRVDRTWATTTTTLLDGSWVASAERIAALAHPVRVELLRHVLRGAGSTAALTELDVVATTGQLYHHLRPLLAAGWLRQAARGRYEVPADRVVPLLVVIAATGDIHASEGSATR